MKSLRAQITVSAVVLVALAVALSGVVIATRIDDQDRSQVDAQLRARVERIREDEDKARRSGVSVLGVDNGAGHDSSLLVGTDAITRVLSDSRVVAQRGEGIADGARVDVRDGWSTVTIDGRRWRSLVVSTTAAENGRLQVLQSLEPVESRLHANVRLIAEVGIVSTLATALAVWLAAGLVLRPLGRLRTGARSIRPGSEQRLPEVRCPQEIAELSATLNAMLERLNTSMQATRRFTADAGHELRTPLTGLGMDLETLGSDPMVRAGHAEIVAAMSREHARVVALLDGLQRLARGDAEALPERAEVEVSELVVTAVEAARRRHPTTMFAVENDLESATVDGWADGIGVAVSNLLDNAALHGREGGRVDIVIRNGNGSVRISVDDDGGGVAEDQRERVLQRFARGRETRSEGSGLGLAIVDQQARLHGGSLELAPSALGGLRAVVTLPCSTPTAES